MTNAIPNKANKIVFNKNTDSLNVWRLGTAYLIALSSMLEDVIM